MQHLAVRKGRFGGPIKGFPAAGPITAPPTTPPIRPAPGPAPVWVPVRAPVRVPVRVRVPEAPGPVRLPGPDGERRRRPVTVPGRNPNTAGYSVTETHGNGPCADPCRKHKNSRWHASYVSIEFMLILCSNDEPCDHREQSSEQNVFHHAFTDAGRATRGRAPIVSPATVSRPRSPQ